MLGTLTVNSILGVDQAELVIADGVTLVVGDNGVGKTSIIETLRCILLSQDVPLNLAKKDVNEVLHNGAKQGEGKFATRTGTRTLSLSTQKCEIKLSNGSKGINASLIATGMSNFRNLKPEDRTKLLIDVLGAKATEERLRQELETTELDKELINNIVTTIVGTKQLPGKGFEAGEKLVHAEALAKKREFRVKTSTDWNTQKGFSYLPPFWDIDLEQASTEALEKAIVEAREAREHAIANNAITEDKLEELKVFVATKAVQEEKLAEYEKVVADTTAELEPLQEELANAQLAQEVLTCPSCAAYLKLLSKDGKRVLEAAEVAPTGVTAEELQKQIKPLKARLENAQMAIGLHKNTLDKIVKQEKEIKDLESKVGDGTAIAKANEALEIAQRRLKAKQQKEESLVLHKAIKAHLAALEICKPEGLQKRLLATALDAFNKELATLSVVAGWNVVSIDDDMVPRFGGRNARIVSGAEKYIVDATIRVALAKQEKAPIVLFDDCETLKRSEYKNGFFKMLKSAGVPAVVGMAVSTRDGVVEEKVPDLEAAKMGITYLVERGSTRQYKKDGQHG